MNQGVKAQPGSFGQLEERLVRYADLRPCVTAFIDTRTPGSADKENFTIIGPGVAENPDQHVHIDIPHGFNIGGARQPPGCINSQHSHETAEVFVVHSGQWAFLLGPDAEDGEVTLNPGDTISIPTNVFRGFKNTGDDAGFLFAVLGGDDPGKVTWAPYVFDAAAKYGLILLEDGSLVDTAGGEKVPTGKRPMPPTSAADVASCRRLTPDQLRDCVVTAAEIRESADDASAVAGVREYPIIGPESPSERLPRGKLNWPHGFNLRQLVIEKGEQTSTHVRHEEEVIFLQSGRLAIQGPSSTIELAQGDTFTTPVNMPRKFLNLGDDVVTAYVVRGGDHPCAPTLVD